MADKYHFIRISAVSPLVHVAVPERNADEIIAESKALCSTARPSVILFPELCVSGYTCGELFNQQALYEGAEKAVERIARETAGLEAALVVGAPVRHGARLYNAAIVLRAGKILGIVPKAYLPGNGEFYEPRYFETGTALGKQTVTAHYAGFDAPMGILQLFRIGDATIGIEVCQDIWTPIPPSTYAALSGAEVILNLSASDEEIGKHEYRRNMIGATSARLLCGYVYCSCGFGESSSDLVWGASSMVYENGARIAENERYKLEATRITADLDLESIRQSRAKYVNYSRDGVLWADAWPYTGTGAEYKTVDCGPAAGTDFNAGLLRSVDPHPFVGSGSEADKTARCREVLDMQVSGLATRLKHLGKCRSIIGVSGGLDSALALIVACETYDRLGWPRELILAVSMPGFGTSERTHGNALELPAKMGVESREISIVPACTQHFKDIAQDPSVHDLTYENAQARERTQILMDLAGKEGGIVIGTGDLSELALGWCTYNGDHMSMYGVNSDVPKTLIREIVGRYAAEHCLDVLKDIVDTPISPELVPGVQPTEDIVGPYELHDFFLYHFFSGKAPEKILLLAENAFAGAYSHDELRKWLKVFVKRFFASQFKRSCMPDGPKIGSVALSPRGDWRMSSDTSAELWLNAF